MILHGWQELFFQDTPSYSGTKTSKKACVKENEHEYLFSLFLDTLEILILIFRQSQVITVYVKLKHLNSYDYIFNPVSFIIRLEDRHFGSWGNILVSNQNKS